MKENKRVVTLLINSYGRRVLIVMKSHVNRIVITILRAHIFDSAFKIIVSFFRVAKIKMLEKILQILGAELVNTFVFHYRY